jgi:HSP20 family protein
MAQKNKERTGNGAKTQPQAGAQRNQPEQQTLPSRWTGWSAQHPLMRLREEMDAMFDRFFGRWPTFGEQGWGPERIWDMDVEETDKNIVVRAEAPGFEPQDFDIHVSDDRLTIRAEHKQKAEHKEGETRSWERRYSRFQRSLPLPAPVVADKVEAHYRNGILELRLPRAEEAQRKRIEVKS